MALAGEPTSPCAIIVVGDHLPLQFATAYPREGKEGEGKEGGVFEKGVGLPGYPLRYLDFAFLLSHYFWAIIQKEKKNTELPYLLDMFGDTVRLCPRSGHIFRLN